MNNKGIIAAAILLVALSVWGVSSILTLRDSHHQVSIVVVLAIIFILLSVKRFLPVDGKLLIILMFGYFIGGKGFAYVSPMPPVYVGEIFFVVSLLFLIIRSNLNLLAVCNINALNGIIIVACMYGGLRVLIDFKTFGMMSIRDSAMIYYSLFAVSTCLLYENKKFRETFSKLLPYMVVLGLLSYLVSRFGGAAALHDIIPMTKKIYAPHVDIAGPILVCASLMGFHFLRNKPTLGIALLTLSLLGIATGKSSFVFCFLFTAIFMVTVGRMRMIIGIGSLMAFFSIMGVMTISVVDQDSMNVLVESDVVETMDALATGDKKTTTGWRLEWWRIVFRDTYDQNPIFGLGLGSDITSPFMREYMGIEVTQEHFFYLTRYPHNIVFTVFGRLGFVGLVFFAIYSIVFFRFCCKYCRCYVAIPRRELLDVILVSFTFAGFCNAFVQSTYENPYAGIPHWIALGVMIARYSRKKEPPLNSSFEVHIANSNREKV